MKQKIMRFITVTLLLFLIVSSGPAALAASVQGEYLEKTLDFVRDNYLEPLQEEALTRWALQGIFNNLDSYSRFYTPKEAEIYLKEIVGVYGGIGAVLTGYGDFAVIYEVQPDSPAARSGLLPGDKITAVEGVSVVGLGVGPVVTMLKGEEGTSIAVEIVRGQQKPFSIEITRDIIEINPVITALFGGVGYIKITEFNDNTEKNFLSALETLDKQQITQLVLDLRDNPGGAADQAVAVAKQLIPRGLITRLDFKSEESEDISFYSDLDKKKYNLAVLVNGMSASAAEILAGAVQDARAGTLVGSRTYGKSKVQTVLPLLTPDAYSKYARLGARSVNALKVLELEGAKLTEEDILGWLKLTTGEYFTPAGRRIDQVGLTPDVAVEGYLPLHGIDVHGIDKLPRTTPLAQGSKDIAVINAEKILKLLNYTVNTPDLSLDTITAAALKEYQQKKKIRATGALDILTQAELNKDLDRLILEIDTPLAKAIELLL